MKKVLLMLMLLIPMLGYAQQYEPEFSNSGMVVYGLPSDSTSVKLERTPLRYSSGTGWGNPFVPKSHAIADGGTSNCKVPANQEFVIIIRCKDNTEDPSSFIQIVKFDKKKKERKLQVASYNVFLDKAESGNKIKQIMFDGKKYGSSSFMLYPTINEPGEYGVLVYNYSNHDEKPGQVLCFTIE